MTDAICQAKFEGLPCDCEQCQSDAFAAAFDASADTHPKDGDAQQAPASLSGAVPAGQTPKTSRGTDHG